jgi:geranylgeranyl diphosphate synthase type I
MVDLETIWQRYRVDLEEELKFAVGKASSPLYDMMRYHLGWIDETGHPRTGAAGKRLRPFFCLLACQSVGGEWRQALPVAAALELVHNFSLIHDDIQDASSERRGRPTVWHIWGQPQAINVGDGMHALALSSLLRLEEAGVEHRKVVHAARLLGEASLKLCEGQYLDINYESRLDVGVTEYLEMISGKTAALFRCSLEIGALVGTGDDELMAHLRSFGNAVGMVFQVHDDVLSMWGNEKTTGKPTTADIEMKKKTLPVVYALENADGPHKDGLRAIYKKEGPLGPDDVQEVLRLLGSVDARGYVQDMADKYHRLALSELEATDIPQQAKEELRAIATFLLEREH